MRAQARDSVLALISFSLILASLTMLYLAQPFRAFNHGSQMFVDEAASITPPESEPGQIEYLVRPEAPEIGVNIVREVHQRAPATDAEAAEWLEAEEMITVEPGTAVTRVTGNAPGYAVSVEVLVGPNEGLRGWVWQDTLRKQWP